MPLQYPNTQGTQPILNFDLVSPLRAGRQDANAEQALRLQMAAGQRQADLFPLQQRSMELSAKSAELGMAPQKLASEKATYSMQPGESGKPRYQESADLQMQQEQVSLESLQQDAAARKQRFLGQVTENLQGIVGSVATGGITQAVIQYDLLRKSLASIQDPGLRQELDSLVSQFDPLDSRVEQQVQEEKLNSDTRLAVAKGKQEAQAKIAYFQEILNTADPALAAHLINQGKSEGRMSSEEAKVLQDKTQGKFVKPFDNLDPVVSTVKNSFSKASKLDNKPTAAKMLDYISEDMGTVNGLGWKNWTEMKTFMDNNFAANGTDAEKAMAGRYGQAFANMVKQYDGEKLTFGFSPMTSVKSKQMENFLRLDMAAGFWNPSAPEDQWGTSDYTTVAAALLGFEKESDIKAQMDALKKKLGKERN
jgi:hypothetical protein